MKPIITGTLQPIKVRTRTSFDPTKGITVTQDYESAGDNLNGMAQQAAVGKLSYDLTPSETRSRISIVSSGPQAGFGDMAVDSWQLICNERQYPIKFSASVRQMLAADPDSLHIAEKAVEDYREGGASAVSAVWFTDNDTQSRLFRFLIAGGTTFDRGEYVLRHQTNVSNSYGTNVADTGVESVYSTAQLVSEITNASFWLFPCPGRLVAKINNIEVQQPSNSDLNWGWRKLPSQETTAAGNRIDISTEYWLNGWPVIAYAPL